MPLIRHMLEPVARLAAAHADRQRKRFLAAVAHGRRTQDALLTELLAEHAASGFGRDHSLGAVGNWDDFRRAVPIRDFAALAPYMDAVWQGRHDALLAPGVDPVMFALTSGTTGQPKRIPIPPKALADYRRGWHVFGMAMMRDHRRLWMRKIVQVTSGADETRSPAGVPCGAISGLLATSQKRIVRTMYPVPPAVGAIASAESRYYTIMRLALAEDVGLIVTANPSTVLRMFDLAERYIEPLLRDLTDGTLTTPDPIDPAIRSALRLRAAPPAARAIEAGLARDGLLRADHAWDLAVLNHWTGGTLSLYLPQVRRRCPGVPIRDIGLLASEGRFSVPLTDDGAGGVAEITSSVLEFVPAEQIDQDEPDALRAHEVQPGRDYFLIVTNRAGLWRYNIGDCVRVTGFVHDTPIFQFLSKGKHTANLTGEKLTEHQVVQAVRKASRSFDLAPPRFVAQPVFAQPPHYSVTIELPGPAPAGLAEAVDEFLAHINVEYASKRASGRLAPVALTAAKTAWFDQREQRILARRGSREQYKHQYLISDVAHSPDPAQTGA